jgi:flavin reductase (DIM6/NTAB) family NADH-FMN oxidoreductase RutF
MSPASGLSPAGTLDTENPPPFKLADRNKLRGVMGWFATGVTVVTAGSETPMGMTANSFTSVSLDPPLILVCVNRQAAIHQAVLDRGSFAVSVLSARQEHVARYFANHARPRGQNEFDFVSWSPGPNTGSPILQGAIAWVECSLAGAFYGGDHSIFLGSVLACEQAAARDALLCFKGGLHRLELGDAQHP